MAASTRFLALNPRFEGPGIVAGVPPGVPDFGLAFARLPLGACVDSSSGSCRLEDKGVVEEEESVAEEELDSERGCVVSGTTNCCGSCSGWNCC